MKFLTGLTRLLVPAPCLLCRASTVSVSGLCRRCDRVWGDKDPMLRCPVCAIRVSVPDIPCAECLQQPRPFDRVIAGVDYDDSARALIHRLKFQHDTAVMSALLRPLITAIACRRPTGDVAVLPDALVPMPIHPQRRRDRGFNQARLMADSLGRRFALPVCGHVVKRVKMGDPQSSLDAAARRKSLRGAFVVTGRLPERVAIVDDVMTTGSTVESLSLALRKAGVREVSVWVAARTPRPDG